MVTIATYNDPAKAKHLRDKFREAGVKADLHNEANLQTYAFMSKPKANAQVMVEDADFDRAQALMVDWEAADPEISALHCPQCNSTRIQYPQLTRKFITPGARRDSFRAENFPEGILLPGLPVHLDRRGGTATSSSLGSAVFRVEAGRLSAPPTPCAADATSRQHCGWRCEKMSDAPRLIVS